MTKCDGHTFVCCFVKSTCQQIAPRFVLFKETAFTLLTFGVFELVSWTLAVISAWDFDAQIIKLLQKVYLHCPAAPLALYILKGKRFFLTRLHVFICRVLVMLDNQLYLWFSDMIPVGVNINPWFRKYFFLSQIGCYWNIPLLRCCLLHSAMLLLLLCVIQSRARVIAQQIIEKNTS